MIQFRYWSIRLISHIKWAYGLASGFLLILLMAQNAGASNYYSKQYGLPCSKCHDNIPTLKEFGQSFKSNGYSFEKKVSSPKKSSGDGETRAKESKSPFVANTEESASEKSKADSAPDLQSSPQPEKIEYLFRGQSEDGTYIFSDNPLSSLDEITSEKSKKNAGIAKKIRKGGVTKNKSALTGKLLKKRNKKIASLKETAGKLKNGEPDLSVTQPPGYIAEAKPRNFEECTGEILMNSSVSINSTQMMELFEMAERRCAPYATPR